MSTVWRSASLLFTIMVMTSSVVCAHSPVLPEDGESLATATHVEDPAKSWAIYGDLDGGGDTWYFVLELGAGDRLYASVIVPVEGFTPTLVAMGPGLGLEGEVPSGVDVPEGAGWTVVEGASVEAEYEPFTPGGYHHVAKVDTRVNSSGTYYLAVHSEEDRGPFGIAVGYEERFTIGEWLAMPARLLAIYRWEGQSWSAVWGPAVAVAVLGMAGLAWLQRRRQEVMDLFQWATATAGVMFLAWAATLGFQMGYAMSISGPAGGALVTAAFMAGSVWMGYSSLRPALEGTRIPDRGVRLRLLMVTLVALGLYSGLFLGPILSALSALIPGPVAAWTPPFRSS